MLNIVYLSSAAIQSQRTGSLLKLKGRTTPVLAETVGNTVKIRLALTLCGEEAHGAGLVPDPPNFSPMTQLAPP